MDSPWHGCLLAGCPGSDLVRDAGPHGADINSLLRSLWPREMSPSVLSVVGGPPGKGVTASSLDWLPGKEPPNGPHGPQERTSALQSSVLRPPFLKSLVLAD